MSFLMVVIGDGKWVVEVGGWWIMAKEARLLFLGKKRLYLQVEGEVGE